MAPDRRGAPPVGHGSAPQEIIALGSGDGGEDSPDQARPQGLIPIGPIAAEIVADMKYRRQVERLHLLGPRVTAEMLAELGAERSIMTVIDAKLTRYAELDAEALEAAGGDRFWPVPLYEVRDA